MPELDTSPDWGKTRRMKRRLADTYDKKVFRKKRKNEQSYFQGRPIIARDTPINGGVYLGEGAREAIVVDESKDPSIQRVFQELIRCMGSSDPKTFLLSAAWKLVLELMPYDSANVNRIVKTLLPDQKIYLSAFIGGGVCRHQALLIGYLLEKCISKGFLNGKVSIDRNSVSNIGGHAWVRYVSSAGKVFILDPAQRFIGPLEEKRDGLWPYRRPSEGRGVFNKLRSILSGSF